MDLRPLGDTGIFASPIALGLFKLGRNTGIKYPQPYELPSDEECLALLRTAADLGINLLDTAPAYGSSEARLGDLMRSLGWPGGRDGWVISTKVGEEFADGRSSFDFTPEAVTRSVERSRRRIGVDHLDIVLIHANDEEIDIIERRGTLEALLDLKARGTIRAAGLSARTHDGGVGAIGRGADVLMVTLNGSETGAIPLIRHATDRGVGIMVKKPLASGHGASSGDHVRESLRLVFDEGGPGATAVVGTLNPAHLRDNVLITREILGDREGAHPPRLALTPDPRPSTIIGPG